MECTALKMWPHQYMRLKWVAMKIPCPQVGQALRNRCTLPESSTCIGAGQINYTTPTPALQTPAGSSNRGANSCCRLKGACACAQEYRVNSA